jgi:hypothetical protein
VSGDELTSAEQTDVLLDDAIDTVVREIMGAEPPAGLRQRVLRRLSRLPRLSNEERRPLLTAPRLAFVAALALCLAVGVFVARRSETTPPVQIASAPSTVDHVDRAPVAKPSLSSEPVPIVTRHPRPSDAFVRTRRGREHEDRMVSATSLTDADNTVVITPLDPIRRIETEPMADEMVQIDQITVAPLQMERVRLDPLSSTPR